MKKQPRRNYAKADLLFTQTRGLLRHFGLRARKGLGQHFLVDGEVLEAIILAAGLTPTDVVIEVGPGLGVLTRELAKRAGRVISVELDRELAGILRESLSSFDNVTVVSGDILKIDSEALVQEEGVELPHQTAAPFSYKVVANLPYYITSPVLRHFLEASLKPELMVLMVQKEVAEAIVANPGKMSLLSVSVQFYGKPQIVSPVAARSFYPAPKVDSAILRVDLYPEPVFETGDTGSFFELVRAGFSTPRKQLINSLMFGLRLPKGEILALLEKAGIEPKRRAESLTLDEWQGLWTVFTQEVKKGC